jgi:Zn-dependent protease
MFKSWRIGKLLGFPIELNVSFLMLLGLVFMAYGGLSGVFVVCLAFGSVLLHELGHAVVARKLGVHVSGIELGFLGGAAKMQNLPRNANQELMIAAAGPAVSLVLAGLGIGLGGVLHLPLVALVGWINLVIAGFNLIPALPMDGGRILRAALSKKMDFVRATDVSVTIARAVAIAFGILGLYLPSLQLLVLAPFLWMMGTREKLIARTEDFTAGNARQNRDGWGAPVRRFTIAHRNGRIVIEQHD